MRVSSYRLRKQSQQLLWAILRTLLILGIAFVILHPLIEKLSMSFKAEIDMYDPTVDLIPKHFTLNNYVEMIDVMEYGSTLLCTLLLCSGTALLTTLSTTMAGYGFAKFPFKLNRLLFACVLVCMVVPPQTIMMSQFLNMRFFSFFGLTNLFGFKGFDLTNSPASLFLLSAFCSGIKNAFFIFIMRQYFKGFPNELYEAAAIDGANSVKKFFYITLPGLRNVISFIVVYVTIQAFKVFTQPYIMTFGGPQNSTRTLVYYIYQQGFQYKKAGYASAMAVVFFLIVVLVSMALKRLLIERD